MNIKCNPQDEKHPKHLKIHTNIGEFFPGEVRGVSPGQEVEAARLVANGDFSETDEVPNTSELAEGILESTIAAAASPKQEAKPEPAKDAEADAKAKSKKK